MAPSMTAQPIVMDVDTGVDDAVALMLAIRSPEVDLRGVTTVAGNVDVLRTTNNTLRMLAAVGRADIPVYRGMASPLARPLRDAADFHGANGLGGAELPPAPATEQPTTAPEFIVQSARAEPGALSLVCTGPLTNLAVALSLEPDLPRLLRQVVVMGGAYLVPGNTTRFAEFNVHCDPEAAAAVARSDLPLTLIGLDVTHQVSVTRDDWQRIAALGGPDARLITRLLRRSFEERHQQAFHLHDPLALASTMQSDLVETEKWPVAVETGVGPRAGQSRLTRDPEAPRHSVAMAVDSARFFALFQRRLGLE